MKVSIITVSYNAEKTIADTINSVINQSYKNIEYIIVDGLSSDSTINIVNSFNHEITKVISEKDRGLYDAMNKGIRESTGEVIGFINSDDFYANKKVVENVVQLFNESKIDGCYSDLCYVDSKNTSKISRYWKSDIEPEDSFSSSWVPPHPTFFVKKIIYKKYGNFNIKFNYAADFDLMLRFMKVHKIKTKYVPDIFVNMRLGGQTNKSLKNILLQNLEIFNSLKLNQVKFSYFKFVLHKLFNRFYQSINS